MNIAIISDTHDNIWKLEDAMPHLRSADAIIHCGDLCAPFMLKRLGEGLPEKPVHIVWGNNDGDPFLISKVASSFPEIQIHGQLAQLELDGVRIGVNHYPVIARDLARSGSYDLVCYGHDHTAHESMVGGCLLLNPGELMGLKGKSTLAIVELPGKEINWITLD
jgi:hypothetical protein